MTAEPVTCPHGAPMAARTRTPVDVQRCSQSVRRCSCCDRSVAKTPGSCPKCPGADVYLDRCRQAKLAGATLCKRHVNNRRSIIDAAARREEEEAERKALRRLLPDAEPVGNPLLELQKLAGVVRQWRDMAEENLAELHRADWRFTDAKGAEQLHSFVGVFERSMDRCATVLVAIAKLNLEDRLAAIEERQADAWIAVLEAVFRDPELALSAEQQEKAPDVFIRHLHAVA